MKFNLSKLSGLKRPKAFLLILIVVFVTGFFVLDNLFPADLNPKTQTRVILSKNKIPLRSFPDENGIWRYPVTLDEVSKKYIEALIGYEDRYFYHHPGVNLAALARAAFQWAVNGEIVSGGSTITMQAARLSRPSPRNISGKIIQIFTAFQLELHFSKDEILTYYINHAPFGGTAQGVQAACFAYFDHSAKDLTYAQAALLAVMPQAPSLYRPDRYPDTAKKARNKLLTRLEEYNVWPADKIKEAKNEPVPGWSVETKMTAPILARRLHLGQHTNLQRIETFIDYNLQTSMEQLALDYSANLPPGVSLSILVMNNNNGAIESYVASADFLNKSRFGHVDMVTALRSPGSTMKPFIYAMALDNGLIHSKSLLMDVPIEFGSYHPLNFTRSFSGPVSADKALATSLNIPAVQLLDHLSPGLFYANMINAGFEIKLPPQSVPNLSMALGGFAADLENLVLAYSSIARKGKTIKPRITPNDPVSENRLMSKGAAWIIYDTLLPKTNLGFAKRQNYFALKTGTSYGYRDSWAMGCDKTYTVGVWVGRPDGTPVPGQYGSQTAVPLINNVFQLLPKHKKIIEQPKTVTTSKICWPAGTAYEYTQNKKYNCKEVKEAWVLDNTTPKTLTASHIDGGPAVKKIKLSVTKDEKYRIPKACRKNIESKELEISLWPKPLESWLPPDYKRKNIIPKIHPRCKEITDPVLDEDIKISGAENGDILMKKENSLYPVLNLKVIGGAGPFYWFENSRMMSTGRQFIFSPNHSGFYQILVIDQSGAVDKILLEVI